MVVLDGQRLLIMTDVMVMMVAMVTIVMVVRAVMVAAKVLTNLVLKLPIEIVHLLLVQVLQVNDLLHFAALVLLPLDDVSLVTQMMAQRHLLDALLRVSHHFACLFHAARALLHLKRLLIDFGLAVGVRVSHHRRRGEDLRAGVRMNRILFK